MVSDIRESVVRHHATLDAASTLVHIGEHESDTQDTSVLSNPSSRYRIDDRPCMTACAARKRFRSMQEKLRASGGIRCVLLFKCTVVNVDGGCPVPEPFDIRVNGGLLDADRFRVRFNRVSLFTITIEHIRDVVKC